MNRQKKHELLRVLDRPELPLHNKLSEGDIRDYVKKRKISGSTRRENSRRCRDTFASLKKTCRKQGISFWKYLNDRTSKTNHIPSMLTLFRMRPVDYEKLLNLLALGQSKIKYRHQYSWG